MSAKNVFVCCRENCLADSGSKSSALYLVFFFCWKMFLSAADKNCLPNSGKLCQTLPQTIFSADSAEKCLPKKFLSAEKWVRVTLTLTYFLADKKIFGRHFSVESAEKLSAEKSSRLSLRQRLPKGKKSADVGRLCRRPARVWQTLTESNIIR